MYSVQCTHLILFLPYRLFLDLSLYRNQIIFNLLSILTKKKNIHCRIQLKQGQKVVHKNVS